MNFLKYIFTIRTSFTSYILYVDIKSEQVCRLVGWNDKLQDCCMHHEFATDSSQWTGRNYSGNFLAIIIIIFLSVHLYSALSLQIPNALHVLCQYLANRKHLSDRLK